MEDWMKHPEFSNLSPIKQELLLQAYQKPGEDRQNLAPALMGLIVNANKQGIRFSQKELL